MNELENKELTISQEMMKMQILCDLQDDMENLEKEINKRELYNLKIKILRDLKIGIKSLQLVYPYIISICLITSIFKLSGKSPFTINEKKVYAYDISEVDNNGYIKKDRQYLENNKIYGKLYYYSKWCKNDNNEYIQRIDTYIIKRKNQNELNELLNKDELSINDILGNPIETNFLTKNNITDTEENDVPYIKTIIFEKDKNEYILDSGNSNDAFVNTFLYVIAIIIGNGGLNIGRTLLFNYDYERDIIQIRDDYERNLTPANDLKKLLKIKTNNYNRLTR